MYFAKEWLQTMILKFTFRPTGLLTCGFMSGHRVISGVLPFGVGTRVGNFELAAHVLASLNVGLIDAMFRFD